MRLCVLHILPLCRRMTENQISQIASFLLSDFQHHPCKRRKLRKNYSGSLRFPKGDVMHYTCGFRGMRLRVSCRPVRG
jgi:hypothetical protein